MLFALIHQDRVPLSIALADYHPGTDEWRDVSAVKLHLNMFEKIGRLILKLEKKCLFDFKTNLCVFVSSVCPGICWRYGHC